MGFLNKLLQIVAFIPTIVTGIENLFGAKTGSLKKDKAVDLVGLALNISESIQAKDIVDNDAFQEGLKQVIDGTVKMLNASVWHKK